GEGGQAVDGGESRQGQGPTKSQVMTRSAAREGPRQGGHRLACPARRRGSSAPIRTPGPTNVSAWGLLWIPAAQSRLALAPSSGGVPALMREAAGSRPSRH